MEIVNFVNYIIYMGNKNIIKNPKDKHQLTQAEDIYEYSETGVYLRDDHCDWGSSGMNEFTNEYSESK